ncbi:response regulator [Ideonella sp. B7]|uniref:response regulator n=1 Tax=Ideonella benzenivorans TaxID=2831643 RepID=UPI001CED5175|nr:response regulator [Ideonella benzenivorans]MCA6217969.1 response regulator [Ideonella benzenivorans]
MVWTLSGCTALVIDPGASSRSVLSAQLRDLGVPNVVQCARLADARRRLETGCYDLVLCEMDFPESGGRHGGQDLLDELQRGGHLPWSTLFIMVTDERSYAKVVEAAESALDAYLLKPIATQVLRERVMQAHKRRVELEQVYLAIEAGRLDEAVGLCRQRFEARGLFWRYATRVGIELLIRQGRAEAALPWLDEVLALQPSAWARLDKVRCLQARHQAGGAMQQLQALIASEPGCVEAQDLLGRTHLGQGRLAEALAAFARAVELTPGDLRRQQRLGMLSCYLGDWAAGARALEHVRAQGANSKSFDDQSLVLLAVARFRQRDSKALARCAAALQQAAESGDSERSRRQLLLARALDRLLQRQPEEAVAALTALAEARQAPDFDLEGGWNLLTGLAAAAHEGIALPLAEDWIRAVGRRFMGSRTAAELLSPTVAAVPAWGELLQAAQQELGAITEQALRHSAAGDPQTAVETLLDQAERTLSPRLLDTARGVVARDAAQLADAPAVQARLATVARRVGLQASALPPGLGEQSRQGIRLRTDAATG